MGTTGNRTSSKPRGRTAPGLTTTGSVENKGLWTGKKPLATKTKRRPPVARKLRVRLGERWELDARVEQTRFRNRIAARAALTLVGLLFVCLTFSLFQGDRSVQAKVTDTCCNILLAISPAGAAWLFRSKEGRD